MTSDIVRLSAWGLLALAFIATALGHRALGLMLALAAAYCMWGEQ